MPSLLVGERFGRLVVLELHAEYMRGKYLADYKWLCQCDCGKQKVVLGGNLRFGRTTSCGCVQREAAKDANTKHGNYRHELFATWRLMWRRCTEETYKQYKDYGGRGITVCDRWKSFELFAQDMGTRPEGMTLDRENNDGNYEPSNCRWATRKEQIANQRGKV